MKLPKFLKLSKVVSKDGYRPVLTGVIVKEEEVEVGPPGHSRTVKHLIAYATNSYIFARVDLGEPDSERDVAGPIPVEALKHMERGVDFELGEETIRTGITHYDRVISSALMFTSGRDKGKHREAGEEVKFPNWDGIKPEFGENVLKVGINPRLLMELSQGMGMLPTQGVHLEIDIDKLKDVPNQKGKKQVLTTMRVAIPGNDKVQGLIMPVRVA